jgi:hypothetical protein
MEMKVGLTFACMNLKKLAKMIDNSDRNHSRHLEINRILMREMEKWCRRLTPAPDAYKKAQPLENKGLSQYFE